MDEELNVSIMFSSIIPKSKLIMCCNIYKKKYHAFLQHQQQTSIVKLYHAQHFYFK